MRFSIGKLMSLVAICGVNFFLFGKIGSDPRGYGIALPFGELIFLGGLPMLDCLALLALIRAPGRPGLDDFLLGGCLALMLYLGAASMAAESIRDVTISLLDTIVPRGNRNLAWIVERVTVAVLINLLPQVGVAFLLGRAIRAFRGREAAPVS